jgi:hypothetical protein
MPVLPLAAVWMLGAVGAAFAAKLIVKEWRPVNDELERIRAAAVAEPEVQTLKTLRRDPASGVYWP